MSAIVLTNCTSRKSSGPQVAALEASAWVSVHSAAERWWSQVSACTQRSRADAVYQGRSVQEAIQCAHRMEAQLWFVSAGLGLVPSEAEIPRYNLTLAAGSGSIAVHLNELRARPSEWWAALAKHRGQTLLKLHQQDPRAPLYLALPANYLAMLGEELEAIARDGGESRLWIFTGAPGKRVLPKGLQHRALPYDQRLEVVGPAGTQADFPQRCLKHFLSLELPFNVTASAASSAVQQALAAAEPPTRPGRRSVTDDEAMRLMREHWASEKGQSSRLLRLLRNGLGVACEQGRFRKLYHQVLGTVQAEQGARR